jgi:hypothetical protein
VLLLLLLLLLQIDGLREVMLSEGDKELQDLAREELQQVEKQVGTGCHWK